MTNKGRMPHSTLPTKVGIPIWNGDKIEMEIESTGMETGERMDSRANIFV